MEDFGKILDGWDDSRAKTASDHSDGGRKRGEQEDSDQMEEWLNRYPPAIEEEDRRDDDPLVSDGRVGRRPSPEKIKIEDTLDLHGYHLQEALEATAGFIERSIDSGYRKVQVIHGKGADGAGVLRREIRAYLEHHQLTGAMGYGRGAEGGRGALWIILRERREPQLATDRYRSR